MWEMNGFVLGSCPVRGVKTSDCAVLVNLLLIFIDWPFQISVLLYSEDTCSCAGGSDQSLLWAITASVTAYPLPGGTAVRYFHFIVATDFNKILPLYGFNELLRFGGIKQLAENVSRKIVLRSGCKWKVAIKQILQNQLVWIGLTQDRVRWRAFL
jgi:hypothetical protein